MSGITPSPSPSPSPAPSPSRQRRDELAEEIAALESLIAVRRADLESLNLRLEDYDRIALYLRHHYAHEIADGAHEGLSFADIIIRYLAVERDLTKWRRFWRRLIERVWS